MNKEKIKIEIEKIIQYFKTDIASVRTGRASPSLLENIEVDYYGSKTPLIQLASINIPEPKLIVIQPWDKNSVKEIEKAIRQSDLGLNPINEGSVIRLVIPAMTEERRIEMVKLLHQKAETTKMKIRNVREEEMKILKKQKDDSVISEDDFYRFQEELQKIVDEHNKIIKELSDEKEKEVMTI